MGVRKKWFQRTFTNCSSVQWRTEDCLTSIIGKKNPDVIYKIAPKTENKKKPKSFPLISVCKNASTIFSTCSESVCSNDPVHSDSYLLKGDLSLNPHGSFYLPAPALLGDICTYILCTAH